MSNLVTLTQDEIDRFGIKGKQIGDAITAEEYSKYQKEYSNKREGKPVAADESAPAEKKSSKK